MGPSLGGRVALVTGGSRGIGAAVAVNLRERAEDASKVAAAIAAKGGRALPKYVCSTTLTFEGVQRKLPMKLANSRPFANGNVGLFYGPAA